MMSLTFGLFTQVSGSGPLGPLVWVYFSSLFKVLYVSWFLLLGNVSIWTVKMIRQ